MRLRFTRFVFVCLWMIMGLQVLGAAKPLPPRGSRPVRVMAYNIRTAFADEEDARLHNDWPRRKSTALTVLKKRDPDVIGVKGCRVLHSQVVTRRERIDGQWVYPSDHYPVEATLALKEAKPRLSP